MAVALVDNVPAIGANTTAHAPVKGRRQAAFFCARFFVVFRGLDGATVARPPRLA